MYVVKRVRRPVLNGHVPDMHHLFTRSTLSVGLAILILSSARVGDGHSCPTGDKCDPSSCDRPNDCRGGLVLDVCGCCQVCARQSNQSCGGQYQLYGRCDDRLICVLDIAPNKLITGDEQGVCSVPQEACETLHSKQGCNIVADRCRCSNVTSCSKPYFVFENLTDCEMDLAVRLARKDNRNGDCSDVRCDVVHQPKCPADSVVVAGDIPSGQCCPTQNRCDCDIKLCTGPPDCPSDYELVKIKSASSKPGRCCDRYECQLNGKNCTGVRCPTNREECPDDSYRLPNIISADSCCSIPQGCSCLPNQCPPVSCPSGSNVKILKYGDGKPGSCCHIFECINVSKNTCMYDGQHYKDGQLWHPDSCKTCHCQNGLVFCKAIECNNISRCGRMVIPVGQCCPICIGCVTSSGDLYNNTDTWNQDDCTWCRCEHGHVSCQAATCQLNCRNPRKIPGRCCPVCDEPTVVKPITECPAVSGCNRTCKNGLSKDNSGCYICQCLKDVKKTGSDISHELMAGENACLTGTGDIHQDGHTWFDGCRQCYCHKGKEMCALIICPVPSCPNPFISHGQCCPRCVSGAGTTSLNEVTMTVCQAVDGNYYVEGETWRINKCTECICHEGHVLCEVQSCPPVPCTKPIYLEGQCCASCQRVAQKSAENEVDTPCLSEDGLIKYDDGATWQLTSCRSCICNHGNVECYSQDCPQVTCNRPVHRKNQCCPVCLDSVVGYACEFANSIYNNEDKWNVDECTSCVCLNGQVMCTKKLCNTRCDNPIEVIGQCCPLCRDDDNASDATNGSKAEGNVIYVPTKTIRNDANDKDVRRPFAKPQPKTSYVTVICVTIITLLVISITLLTICCWKQRKKLRYYEHESSIGSKTRPKSANMDYQGALTAFLDQKPNCNSFYTEKTCDCDFKIGGHFNTYSAPPIRSAV